MLKPKCSVEGCERDAQQKGMCLPHRVQIRAHGKILSPTIRKIERHSRYGSKEYIAWRSMIERCENPKNKGFHNYGGRGICVCKEWRESFSAFFSDMGPNPGGMELDRIDNNGGYFKGNCRWASHTTNSRNRRGVKLNETLVREIRESSDRTCVLSKKYGIAWATIDNVRKNRKWVDVE